MIPGAVSDLASRLSQLEAALRRIRTSSGSDTASATTSASGLALTSIDPVVLYNTRTAIDGTLAWTTLDCSASVEPGSTFALVSLWGWNGWDGSTGEAELLFRKDSSAAQRKGIVIRVSHTAYGGSDSNEVLVPLTDSLTFDISITAPGIYDGLSVELIGYVSPAA